MQNPTPLKTISFARTSAIISGCNCTDYDFLREEIQAFLDRLPGFQRVVWAQVNEIGWLKRAKREPKETFVGDLNLATRVIK